MKLNDELVIGEKGHLYECLLNRLNYLEYQQDSSHIKANP